MTSEKKLLSKLEEWLSGRHEPPTILSVIDVEDGELLAAFILKRFREAATRAGAHNSGDGSQTRTPTGELNRLSGAIFRVFDSISDAWRLTPAERLGLLGLAHETDLDRLRNLQLQHVPTGVIERIVILVHIFEAINTLLPSPGHADAWVRKPNKGVLFDGRSAVDIMIDRGIEGLRSVREYLQAEIWSR